MVVTPIIITRLTAQVEGSVRHTLLARIDKTTITVLFCLLLAGSLLLAISVALREARYHGLLIELLREFGVVLFAVFGVSLLYELWLADRHEEHFMTTLRSEIAMGESNASVCALLGIRQIFVRRDKFEQDFPLRALLSSASNVTTVRVCGRSLFLLLTHPHELNAAMAAGARLELCLLDPALGTEELRKSPDLEPKDISAALAVFATHVLPWLRAQQPPGSVEVRGHQFQMLDSFFRITGAAQNVLAWELSFGRDLASKRMFVLEEGKQLAKDLDARYETIWKRSRPLVRYVDKKLEIDEIGSDA